jgi:hypothetical protein
MSLRGPVGDEAISSAGGGSVSDRNSLMCRTEIAFLPPQAGERNDSPLDFFNTLFGRTIKKFVVSERLSDQANGIQPNKLTYFLST